MAASPRRTPLTPLPFAEQVEIFTRFEAANPSPRTELDYSNAFTLLVAVSLSAQATDVGVNRATKGLFAAADTPQKMLALGEAGVTEHIRTIGLFRQKARNIIRLSELLIERHGGEVPSSRAALMALPGVGRKTANVVLNGIWGMPAQAVDTHIFRVANRTRIAPGRDVNEVERAIEDNVPAPFQTVLSGGWWKFAAGDLRCGEDYVIMRRDQWRWRREARRGSPSRRPCA